MRLLDPKKPSGRYSLADLSNEWLGDRSWLVKVPMAAALECLGVELDMGKLDEVQTHSDPEVRRKWREYSTLDTAATWHLYQVLRRELSEEWAHPCIYTDEKLPLLEVYERI